MGESVPRGRPVKGSKSDSGGGEVEVVATEPGASDAAAGRVSMLCMPSAEVEGVGSVCAVGSWPCSSARTASWGVLSAAVKATFRGCSAVRVVVTGGGASTTGGGATVGRLDS